MRRGISWQHFSIALLVGLVLSACAKNETEEAENTFKDAGVFVICEGTPNQSNSRVDFYNRSTKELTADLFQSVNGVPLGDVLQSMLVDGEYAFLVLNNSNKIEVVNISDFTAKATLTGLNSPHYVCKINNTKAYVSQSNSNYITTINTSNLSVENQFPFPSSSAEIITDNSRIWATSPEREYTYIIQNNVVIDSVNIGIGNSYINKGSDGDIWILTTGRTNPTINAKLCRINPTTFVTKSEYELGSNSARTLATNASKTLLYFISGGKVFRKSATENSNPSEFISLSGASFYGLGVDPINGNIWLSDAGDFTSPGTVYIYNSAGTQVKSFTTGVVPSGFAF